MAISVNDLFFIMLFILLIVYLKIRMNVISPS